jgi:hypothetical protein
VLKKWTLIYFPSYDKSGGLRIDFSYEFPIESSYIGWLASKVKKPF